MRYTVTMTTKGQVTIPAVIRESMGLKQGDVVQFFENLDGSVAFIPKNRDVMEMAGALADLPCGEASDDEAALAAALSDRAAVSDTPHRADDTA